jgi:hypothetical protein
MKSVVSNSLCLKIGYFRARIQTIFYETVGKRKTLIALVTTTNKSEGIIKIIYYMSASEELLKVSFIYHIIICWEHSSEGQRNHIC